MDTERPGEWRRAAEAQRQHELFDSEERFRVLVDSVRDYAIFLMDPHGVVVSWNSGAERMKGYAADEIVGQNFSVFYPPEDIQRGKPALMLEHARQQGGVEDEGWRVRKDGTRFWANVIIAVLYDDDGTVRGFAKVTRDLTERREKESAEHRALLLQESSRLKDEFLAILSHELRTPLNVIIGELWRLRNGHLAPGQAERAWESLDRNLRLQARIIDDLLDISRIESGKIDLERQTLDFAALVADACEQMRSAAAARGLSLQVACPTARVNVNGDPARLMQIANNLLTNAIKFTPDGGRVAVQVTVAGGDAVLTVSDDGIGIAADFLPRMFDRFSQSDASTRRAHGGLGVGLAIVKQLVQLHGGTVSAESPGPNQGTTFTIHLPLA